MDDMRKKRCIAMLLAGGQGSRLGLLTKVVAKPAVPFGGKYRIIDFPLSNCANSGIDVVGVLTQYQPLELNRYIGSGQPWGLDLLDGGVFVLPPYMKAKSGEWYRGTANAIYQNVSFIEQYDPDYVLILSGDHIYKMDYNKMLAAHMESGADITIAVRPVPWEVAPSFGIMNVDEENTILEFEEKPKNPKSNLASMGVYIFTWSSLKQYLDKDAANASSKNDFGKNIIPAMLEDKRCLKAYSFQGYWKDVGTIESLWESNMDLLNPNVPLDLSDDQWRIYARNPVMPPHYVAKDAHVQNSLVAEGCNVYGEIDFAVLFAGVYVAPGAVVKDSIVMPGARIEEGARVQYAIVAENSVVGAGAVVGERPEDMENKDDWGVAVIGPGCNIAPGTVVPPKAMIDAEEENK